jgi:hypothetical protein
MSDMSRTKLPYSLVSLPGVCSLTLSLARSLARSLSLSLSSCYNMCIFCEGAWEGYEQKFIQFGGVGEALLRLY